MFKQIQVLSASSEGPNTFWSPTIFKADELEVVRKEFAPIVYRVNGDILELLAAKEEGPNTFWSYFDTVFSGFTLEEALANNPPVDPTRVFRFSDRSNELPLQYSTSIH